MVKGTGFEGLSGQGGGLGREVNYFLNARQSIEGRVNETSGKVFLDIFDFMAEGGVVEGGRVRESKYSYFDFLVGDGGEFAKKFGLFSKIGSDDLVGDVSGLEKGLGLFLFLSNESSEFFKASLPSIGIVSYAGGSVEPAMILRDSFLCYVRRNEDVKGFFDAFVSLNGSILEVEVRYDVDLVNKGAALIAYEYIKRFWGDR